MRVGWLSGLLAGLLLCSGVAEARLVAQPPAAGTAAAAPAAVKPLRTQQETSMSTSVSILGEAEATEEQLVAFIRARNPQPRLNCTIEEIVATYFREGAAEGVRGDIALCQALKETGFFRYGGTVRPQQNNFCGLGTTSATKGGASFTTVERGVRAHIQHLLAYASTQRPRQTVLDPRYEIVKKVHPDFAGGITDWTGLNGTWAVPGNGYGQSILQIWEQAKNDAAVNQRLVQDYTRRIAKGDAEASLKRGKLYAQQKQYAKALADYQTAEKYAPLQAEALVYEAVLYQAEGDAAQAGKTFDKALAADRNAPLAQACLNNFRRRPAASSAVVEHGQELQQENADHKRDKKDKKNERKKDKKEKRDSYGQDRKSHK